MLTRPWSLRVFHFLSDHDVDNDHDHKHGVHDGAVDDDEDGDQDAHDVVQYEQYDNAREC